MPVTFTQIANNTANVTLVSSVGSVTITYYPNKLTDKMVAEINAGLTNDNQLLEDLIKSWDVMDDTVDPPVMFPLNRINEVGILFKQQVAEAIGRDMRPNSVTPQTI